MQDLDGTRWCDVDETNSLPQNSWSVQALLSLNDQTSTPRERNSSEFIELTNPFRAEQVQQRSNEIGESGSAGAKSVYIGKSSAMEDQFSNPGGPREVLNSAQLGELITGDHGLGSTRYRDRISAQQRLQQQGVNALPELLSTLRQGELPLEVNRRCAALCRELLTNNFENLISGVRSDNPAVAQAAELFLSRQSTDTLLLQSTYSQLTGTNRATFNELIRTRLNGEQLDRLAGGDKRTLYDTPPEENSLRLSVAASAVLGRPNQRSSYELGALLMERGGPANIQQADRFLRDSLQSSGNPLLQGSAQRMVSDIAFRRGDVATGLDFAQQCMNTLDQLGPATTHESIAHEYSNLSHSLLGALANSTGLTQQQRERLIVLNAQALLRATIARWE